jgi:hypothetical protein
MRYVPPVVIAPEVRVATILARAGRLTRDEARALDAALRAGPDLEPLARHLMDDHQRYLNNWAMFDHWPHPWIEMVDREDQARMG